MPFNWYLVISQMAGKEKESRDPIQNFLAYSAFISWWIIKSLLKVIVFDNLKWLWKNTPKALNGALKFGKWIRHQVQKKTIPIAPQIQAFVIREIDDAGNVVKVDLYNNNFDALHNVNDDFLSKRDFSKGVPDHTLQLFETSYNEAELDEVRKIITEGDWRYFYNFESLDGVTELEQSTLMAEKFKQEHDIASFGKIEKGHIFLYDIFKNEQDRLALLAALDEKFERGDFSSQVILDNIEGRTHLSINDFAAIMNKHTEQFKKILNSELAMVLLDAIAHHPEIHRLGGMRVEQIASLQPDQVQPISELVLLLISATEKNPELAEKARCALVSIIAEKEWVNTERSIFENSYDDKECADLINKYTGTGNSRVLHEMMAIVYMKTLDERKISYQGLFSPIVNAFSDTFAVKEILQKYSGGEFKSEAFPLSLYFGAVQRLTQLRVEMSTSGVRYQNDLFGDNEHKAMLSKEIAKYTDILNRFHNSFEIKNLNIQKVQNIRTAISNGLAMNMDGTVKAEVVDATKWLIQLYSDAPEVIAQFADILKGTALQSLCYTRQNNSNFTELNEKFEWNMTQEEFRQSRQQVLQEEVLDNTVTEEQQNNTVPLPGAEIVPCTEAVQDDISIDNNVIGQYYAGAIETYGASSFFNSVDYMKSFADGFFNQYPQIEQLDIADYERAQKEGLKLPDIPESNKDLRELFIINIAGMCEEYNKGNIDRDQLLYSAGYDGKDIKLMPEEDVNEAANKISSFWSGLVHGRSVESINVESQDIPTLVDINPVATNGVNILGWDEYAEEQARQAFEGVETLTSTEEVEKSRGVKR